MEVIGSECACLGDSQQEDPREETGSVVEGVAGVGNGEGYIEPGGLEPRTVVADNKRDVGMDGAHSSPMAGGG